jgi:hypothetical protein
MAMFNIAAKASKSRLPKDAFTVRDWLTHAEKILPPLVKATF